MKHGLLQYSSFYLFIYLFIYLSFIYSSNQFYNEVARAEKCLWKKMVIPAKR